MGTVYQLVRSGAVWSESVVYRFPVAGIVLPAGELRIDESGNLYGVADGGIFELTPHKKRHLDRADAIRLHRWQGWL